MVLPIGGFMPIPLALMIPFMFMQSVMMGYGFGTGFQYSKRKISAMSNEEFNATTMKNESQKMFQAYKEIIPDLKQSITDSKELQSTVLAQMIDIPRQLLEDLFGGGSPTSIPPTGTGPVIQDPRGKTAADVFAETPEKTSDNDFKPPELKNFHINIPYNKTPKFGQRPSDSLVKQTAVQWWFAANNHKRFGSFVNYRVMEIQNYNNKWYYNGTVIYQK